MLDVSERNLERIFSVADNQLLAGTRPEADAIAVQLEMDREEVASLLDRWWQALPGRVDINGRGALRMPDVPETITQSFMRIWQQAVQEAQSSMSQVRQKQDVGDEESRRLSEEALRQSQDVYQELESRYREQGARLEEQRQVGKSLEAEINILKNSLESESNERKRVEQANANLEHELAQVRKHFEDHKRATEQRLSEEQHKNVETQAKMDVEVRHYRNQLDKLRDETGRKESALSRENNDLHGQVARKDAKLDTQKSQIAALEQELANTKQELGGNNRSLSKANADLLAETNKTKRLEAKVKELSEEVERLGQKVSANSTEASRREAAMRAQLKEKGDELMQAQTRVTALEKRLVTRDDEVRRLSAKL
ncbi:plasmid replication DNA-binding protein KfrA [Marinobacterium mangrovicola]|uniref:Plasmid replication DNA-binding protein KfrA n=1 Tax=Marinobacterium mangrovicola TaxID=1476959 RepID=A0A4R1GRS9_9GAMM|nr:plasmid replication DNA-binding protein KfrA [Marinobacterium mangrovicola]